MLRTAFTLIKKTALTHNVYEFIYSCPKLPSEPPKPGQYVMFQLAPGLNRAYSISDYNPNDATFTLIIKKVSDGRGSPRICDAEVGSEFIGMIPLGHFTLRENENSKCFIGTGTGFAPLYFQINATRAQYPETPIAFIFGVRHREDVFYQAEIEAIQKTHTHFLYQSYLSQETDLKAPHEHTGYVTDWITKENIAPYREFYICGSPAMVKDARSRLDELGIPKEQIFFEQY